MGLIDSEAVPLLPSNRNDVTSREPTFESEVDLPLLTTKRTVTVYEDLVFEESDGRIAETYSNADNREGEQSSRNEMYGYFLMLASSCFFCFMTLFSRAALGYASVSVRTLLFFRGPTQAALVYLCASIFYDGRSTFSVPRRVLPLLALRGFCGAITLALFYGAAKLIPLGVATSIFFVNPVFCMLVSSMVLGERTGVRESIAAILSIFGVWLVSNPSLKFDLSEIQASSYVFGILLALIAAAMVSVAMVCIRSLSSKVHFLSNVMAHAVGTTVFGLLLGGPNIHELKNARATFFILGACLAGCAGQCLFNSAFKHCRAGTGSVLRTVDVPLSYILALAFLDEVPHPISLAGSAFVIAGVVIIGLGQLEQ